MSIARYIPANSDRGVGTVVRNDASGTVVFYDDYAAEVARLNEQVRALAAEVQNCRRFVVEHLGPDSGIEFSHLDNKFAESIMSEIRAQAVEGFAQKICSPYEDRGGETYQDGFNGAVDVMLKKAVKYAARIRAGEVSNG